jgi:hypothetical protein
MRFFAVQFVCCICFLQTVVQNVLLVLSGDHPAKPASSHFPCAEFMYFSKMAAGKTNFFLICYLKNYFPQQIFRPEHPLL